MNFVVENIGKEIDQVKTWDDVKKLVTTHKQDLTYLSKYEGLDGFLGSGHYGKVFKIKGEELTLKVTFDAEEIKLSEAIKGKDLEAFIKVYYQKVLKPDLAVKIQDLLYPVRSSKTVEAIHEIHTKILPNLFPDPERIDWKMFDRFKGIVGLDVEKVKTFLQNVYKEMKALPSISLEVYDLDINPGNVMQDKSGNLKLVDF